MNVTRLRYLVAATALMLMTFPLYANVLHPGDTNVAPDVFSNPGNPPLLGNLTGTFSFGGLTGSWQEVVLIDPLGVTCSGAGLRLHGNRRPGLVQHGDFRNELVTVRRLYDRCRIRRRVRRNRSQFG